MQSSRSLRPEQLFPELKDPSKWASRMWSRTVTFLHIWGEGAAIIVSLVATGRIISAVITWLYGVVVLRDVLGCTRQLAWTCCPDIFLLRQYREFNKNQREGDADDSASSTMSEVMVKRSGGEDGHPPPKRQRGFLNSFHLHQPARVDPEACLAHQGHWATGGVAPHAEPEGGSAGDHKTRSSAQPVCSGAIDRNGQLLHPRHM
jgi:hypothetical protein